MIDEVSAPSSVGCTAPNRTHALKPSTFARVTLNAPADRHLLSVPVTALLSDGDPFCAVA